MIERSISDPAPWQSGPGAMARFLGDLVSAEFRQLRPGARPLPPAPWLRELPLGAEGLGLDSLERMEVAAALSETLHLHESGSDELLSALPTFGEWIDTATRGVDNDSRHITFRTSGSTGEPKRCPHALSDLLQEVDGLAQIFQDARRIVSTVPAHHIYGFLFTILLPNRLGNLEVVDARHETPQTVARRLRSGDLLVSHPTHWSLMARHAGPLPPAVTGVTSTAPCPPALALELARRDHGLFRLVEIYGSSETAGVGWRDTPADPFLLMPHWARAPGTELAGLIRTPGGTGEPVHLQDVVEWVGERTFRVIGRRDSAVQIGGINVFPQRVSAVLRTHPQVQEAVVRQMASHEGGRLKAFVVARADADLSKLRAELDRWADEHLGVAERPKAYTFGHRLPSSENGKDCDWV